MFYLHRRFKMAEMFNWITTALISIGTSGAIIYFIAKQLSKLWIEKTLLKDRQKYIGELEGIKQEYQKELTALQYEFDESNHISITQYDKEFQIYQEIWRELINNQKDVDRLFKQAENLPDDHEEYKQFLLDKHSDFAKSFNAFSICMSEHAPFYSEDIKSKLEEYKTVCFEQGINFSTYFINPINNKSFQGFKIGDIKDPDQYKDAYINNPRKIGELATEVEQSIREHLASLKIE